MGFVLVTILAVLAGGRAAMSRPMRPVDAAALLVALAWLIVAAVMAYGVWLGGTGPWKVFAS